MSNSSTASIHKYNSNHLLKQVLLSTAQMMLSNLIITKPIDNLILQIKKLRFRVVSNLPRITASERPNWLSDSIWF